MYFAKNECWFAGAGDGQIHCGDGWRPLSGPPLDLYETTEVSMSVSAIAESDRKDPRVGDGRTVFENPYGGIPQYVLQFLICGFVIIVLFALLLLSVGNFDRHALVRKVRLGILPV